MQLSREKEIEKLYETFRQPLLRYISHKVADAHSAEEILNDVFFKAANSLETLKEKTKVQSWLYKIASNRIIDYYRRRKENYVDIDDALFYSNEDENETIYDELNCCVEKFLHQLPKHYSDPLKAVYLEEQTQQEYAEQNKVKLSTVKSRIKRGKASMKTFFEQCCTFEKDRLNNMTHCTPKNSATKKC
ncbi:sigma-70 family RNA polymerase sigma factor [Sulfurimonas sp. HSL3-7]|uniref:sigma-70 family RNA polymerase sigma factor n=1 Tax=Sulfonitrofixus jiaomeiensis TaxID=3131938 RepID=UPI0031F798BA